MDFSGFGYVSKIERLSTNSNLQRFRSLFRGYSPFFIQSSTCEITIFTLGKKSTIFELSLSILAAFRFYSDRGS